MIDEVQIECDEDGFHLILIGDLVEAVDRYLLRDEPLNLRLSQDAAIQLLAATRSEIGPWVVEMESERHAFSMAGPRARAEVMGLLDWDSDAEGGPDPEVLREGADLARKAARERGEA